MTQTANFGLDLVAAAQAQKHVPVNTSFDLIDALMGGVVQSATADVTVAAEGDVFIVPEGFTGFTPFETSGPALTAGDLAIFSGGVWRGIPPRPGWRFRLVSTGETVTFADPDGRPAGWFPGHSVGTATGHTLDLGISDLVATDLDGSSVTLTGLIPERVILLGVAVEVVEDIAGASDFDVGDGVSVNRFGGALGTLAGAENIGVIGPVATYAPGDVVLTANGGDFTAGRVHVSVSFIRPLVPA